MGYVEGIPINTECNMMCFKEMQLQRVQEEINSELRLLPLLIRPRLVQKCLEAGDGLGVLLAFVGDVQERYVAVLLADALQERRCDGAGHAGEGHDVHDPRDAPVDVVDRLAHGEDGLSLEGGMDVGTGGPVGLGDRRLVEAPHVPVEAAQEPVLVTELDPLREVRLDEVFPRPAQSRRGL